MSSEDENLESLAQELGFETPAASRSTVQTSGELGSRGGYLSSVRAGNMFASDEESVPVFVVNSEGGEDVCRGLIGVGSFFFLRFKNNLLDRTRLESSLFLGTCISLPFG
jgi:hypothetical protein